MKGDILRKLGKISLFTLTSIIFSTTTSALNNSATKFEDQKDWKISAYLDGDSIMDHPSFLSLNLMEKIGSNEVMDIYALLDRFETKELSDEAAKLFFFDPYFGTRMFYVKKDDDLWKIGSQQLEGFEKERNMGAYRTFRDFLLSLRFKKEAKRHMMIIKGHGYGIMVPLTQILYGISSNPEEDNALSTYNIQKVFEDQLNRKLDVLVFDSCEKSTIEVAYQLRNRVKIMIASQDLMWYYTCPGESKRNDLLSGLPYDKILKYINNNPSIANDTLGKYIIRSFFEDVIQNGFAKGDSFTLSAIELQRVDSFVKKFSRFSSKLVEMLEDLNTRKGTIDTLTNVLKEVQHYYPPDKLGLYEHIDLLDFLNLLEKYTNDRTLKQLIQPLKSLDFIIDSQFKGPRIVKSCGVSILFMTNIYSCDQRYGIVRNKKISEHLMDYYNKCDFAKATGWGKVIELFNKYSLKALVQSLGK